MPRIIGSSLEEHRERMNERIFEALERLMAERGYDAVTLADVAAAAGFARTAMYNYYADKESLLLAFTAHRTGTYLAGLNAALEAVSTPIDRLRVFVRMQLELLATSHVAPSAWAVALSEEGHRRMAEHVAPLWDVLRGILADAVEERYLPDEDVDVLVPLVTGTIAGRSTAELSGARLEHAIEATTLYVLRGLGARLSADGRPRRLPR